MPKEAGLAAEGTPPRLYCVLFRPPTWAQGQAPRQGPILGNNAPVFLPVEGRSGEDEVGQTRKPEGEIQGGLSPSEAAGAGSFPEARVGAGMPGSRGGEGGRLHAGTTWDQTIRVFNSSRRELGGIQGGTARG